MTAAANRRWARWRVPFLAASMAGLATIAAVVIGASRTLPRPPHPVEAAIAASWPSAAHARLWAHQDRTQRDCTQYGNNPPDREAVAIMEREWRAIVYPADGVVFGDWQRGAELARDAAAATNGLGAKSVMGGQCATCHQLEGSATDAVDQNKSGPALTGYGRNRAFAAAEAKLLYEQIYSSNAVIACSIMPRFGAHKVLTPEQIRDIVAYLLSPQSPVNAGPDTRADVLERR